MAICFIPPFVLFLNKGYACCVSTELNVILQTVGGLCLDATTFTTDFLSISHMEVTLVLIMFTRLLYLVCRDRIHLRCPAHSEGAVDP